MKVKVSFTSYMLEDMGVVKLGRLSGEDLDISSWWSRMDAKLDVSGRIDLVVDMATDVKR